MLSQTQNEIQKGLWMIAPQMAYNYIQALHKKEKKSHSNLQKQIQAVLIREVYTPDGREISPGEEIPDQSIGVVRCIGPMLKYGSWYNWGSDELVEMARDFDDHPNIIGQIWDDDSGGGSTASVAPYIEFLEQKKKPVVSLMDMSGSANYWKNVGTDHLMAKNKISAMFGSIGIMAHLVDFSKMLKEAGIVEHTIYADPSEDKNKAFDLALKGKYELIKQEFLNPLAITFQDYVKANRPNLNLDEPGIITGKMFYAEHALDIGLIDSIGNMQSAIEKVKLLAGARSFMNP